MYEELNKLSILDVLKLARYSLKLDEWNNINLSIPLSPSTSTHLEKECNTSLGFINTFIRKAYYKPGFTCIVFEFKWFIEELVENHEECVRYVMLTCCKNPRSGHAIRYILSKYNIEKHIIQFGFIIACRFNQLDCINVLVKLVDQQIIALGFKILCMNKLGHTYAYLQSLRKNLKVTMPKSPNETSKKMMCFVTKSSYGKPIDRFKLDELKAIDYFYRYFLPSNLGWIEQVYINREHVSDIKIRDRLRVPPWHFDRSYCSEKYAESAIWLLSEQSEALEPYSAQCILYCVIYQSRLVLKKLLSVYPNVFEKSVLSNSVFQLACIHMSDTLLDLFDQKHITKKTLEAVKDFIKEVI